VIYWHILGNLIYLTSEILQTIDNPFTNRALDFLKVGIEIFNLVNKSIENIAKSIGIIETRSDIRDLGDRAIRADKKIDNFNNTKEYINYLKNEIKEGNKNDFIKLSDEEMLARKSLGTSILSKSIEEEFNTKISVEFWEKATEAGLRGVEIQNILNQFRNVGIEPEYFVKYLKKELNLEDEDKMDNTLLKAYMKLEPNATQRELEEKILSMQRRVNR